MSNRYSALNRRPAATSSLFQDYPGNTTTGSPRPTSPYHNSNTTSPYGQTYNNTHQTNGHPPSYHHKSNGKQSPPPSSSPSNSHTYHPGTPNSKGQYSTSLLESLESQNDNAQTSLLSQKVSQLKSLTVAIGDEIRDSSQLAGQINDSFENTGQRLKGTMRRMLRMAERTGVGWRVWLGFFVAVWLVFAYVWLF